MKQMLAYDLKESFVHDMRIVDHFANIIVNSTMKFVKWLFIAWLIFGGSLMGIALICQYAISATMN